MAPTMVLFAGSTRTGSINAALARVIGQAAAEHGFDVEVVDLGDYPLPLYDADLEASQGVPKAAHDLAGLLDRADAVVIASPEYNGAFTPLLKNTIDWVTRSDKTVFARAAVGLAAATPGRLGGVNGLGVLRATLEHMQVEVADAQVNVAMAAEALSDGQLTRERDRDAVTELVGELLTMVAAEERAAAA